MAAFALAACVACGSPSTSSGFSADRQDLELGGAAPTVTLRASWQYRSSSADVDLELVTATTGDDCASTGKLIVNKVTAASTTYRHNDLDCAELRSSDEDDIILYDRPTGHDWAEEAAPSCSRSCDCPQLRRTFGADMDILPLGRTCD